MKLFVSVFLMLITTNLWAGAGGYIGEYDSRKYGSLENPEYSAITRLWLNETNRGYSRCTGTFIDNNLILTNSHCAVSCVRGENCSADFWDGKKYVTTKIEPIMLNENFQVVAGDDWALMMAYDANPNVRKVASTTTLGDVSFGGYGTLRVIKNEELPIIRKIAEETFQKYGKQCDKEKEFWGCWWNFVEQEVKKAGLKPLTGDSENLKIRSCKIVKNSLSDGGKVYPNMVALDCDSAGGDSGSSLARGDTVVALYNSGINSLTVQVAEDNGGGAVKNQNFYSHINDAKKIVEQKLKGVSKPTQPEQKPTQPEQKPTQPEQKPTQPEQKPTQPESPQPVTDEDKMKQIYEQYMNGFQCD